MMVFALTGVSRAQEQPPVSFGKGQLSNAIISNPTSLDIGPDGRLYVAQQNGVIKAFTVERNGPSQYRAADTETINAVNAIPNHNDDGTPNPGVNTRQVTGILLAGTAQQPVIYVTSSDPRIGAGPEAGDINLDTNSGVLSSLTKTQSGWNRTDLVRGLPRSEENHSPNGIQLFPEGNTLYIAQGGNTNQGAPSKNFAFLPETALSAAILEIDFAEIGASTYDLPTLDDEDRLGASDANDPFGGNDGKNQAILVPGGPVDVYAPGFRNAYDLVVSENGRMYTIDNGGNAGWGDVPQNEGPVGDCTNAVQEPGQTNQDNFHHISEKGYYGGHPNPTRANKSNIFNETNPQSPVATANPTECDYDKPASDTLNTFPTSTNGMDEYTASDFGGR